MGNNLEYKTNNYISQQIYKHTNRPSLFWDVTQRVLSFVYLRFKMELTGSHEPSVNRYQKGLCTAHKIVVHCSPTYWHTHTVDATAYVHIDGGNQEKQHTGKSQFYKRG